MLPMLSVVYNPLSAYIVGYKTVYLQYIRRAVVKDTLLFFASAIRVIIMCCFLLYDVNNPAQYEYYDIAYLSEISKGGEWRRQHIQSTQSFLTKTAPASRKQSQNQGWIFWHEKPPVRTGRPIGGWGWGGWRVTQAGFAAATVGFRSHTHFPESPIF